MKIESLNIESYGNIKKGQIGMDGKRLVRCIGFVRNKDLTDKSVYATWQYILKKTYKPSGKSTCFCKKVEIH